MVLDQMERHNFIHISIKFGLTYGMYYLWKLLALDYYDLFQHINVT